MVGRMRVGTRRASKVPARCQHVYGKPVITAGRDEKYGAKRRKGVPPSTKTSISVNASGGKPNSRQRISAH